MPDQSPNRYNKVFEITVKAADANEAIALAENNVDRDIRNGKLEFPFHQAEQIDCFSVTKIG